MDITPVLSGVYPVRVLQVGHRANPCPMPLPVTLLALPVLEPLPIHCQQRPAPSVALTVPQLAQLLPGQVADSLQSIAHLESIRDMQSPFHTVPVLRSRYGMIPACHSTNHHAN